MSTFRVDIFCIRKFPLCTRLTVWLLVWGILVGLAGEVSAELTPEHRRELSTLRREISKVVTLARQKKFDDAEKLLEETEAKIQEIMTAASVQENDHAIASLKKVVETQRKQYERIKDPAAAKKNEGISFSKEIAPILAANCVSCHGNNNPRGGLRLDTFAGMKRGGSNGALLMPGNARVSPLALRLIAPGQQRMPRGEEPLSRAEISKIAEWINQGARFDHTDETMQMADLSKPVMKKEDKPEIKIAKPEGNETVSFKEDIAPMLVTFCHGCHSGANPASGLSMETFEKLLIGGESGEVLIAGKLEESRLFRLTGGLENPRMPRGEARITRKNYEDLKAWITEGLKYDVEDPKMPLLRMVPTDEEKQAARLASMNDAEFQTHRQERSEQHWKRTLSNAKTSSVTTDKFYVIGNVDEARLQEISGWADETAKAIQQRLGLKDVPTWRGRLAVYVFKDPYDYAEFNRSIENRDLGGAMFGHGRVTPQFENAYIALLDTGDVSSSEKPALKWTLFKAMNSAYLQIGVKTRADWLTEGSGWALADNALRSEDYEKSMVASSMTVLAGVRRPEDLFQAGTFAPAVTEHVGFLVSRFLLRSGSPAQFRQFATLINEGRDINDACRAAYKSTAMEMIQGLRKSLP